MKIPINLATRPFVNTRPFLVTAGVLGLVALVLTLWVAVAGFHTWRQQEMTRSQRWELERQQAALRAEQRQLITALSTPEAQRLLKRKLFLDRLVQRRRLSWIGLFFDLQQHLPTRARILSLSPALLENDHVSLDLRVTGTSASSVIEFVQALEEGEKFRDVTLRSQGEASGRGGGINAVITAVYVQGSND
jgi:type IV pilus assembly protein PilN